MPSSIGGNRNFVWSTGVVTPTSPVDRGVQLRDEESRNRGLDNDTSTLYVLDNDA
jgi:hypothetical protein